MVSLEEKIFAFENKTTSVQTSKNQINVFYNVLNEVISAFFVCVILYKLYMHFFGKNVLLFIFIIFFSFLSVFYSLFRKFYVKDDKIKLNKDLH
jgi:hypothetical protein